MTHIFTEATSSATVRSMRAHLSKFESSFLVLFRKPLYKDWGFWAFASWELLQAFGAIRFLSSPGGWGIVDVIIVLVVYTFFTRLGLYPLRRRYLDFLRDSETEKGQNDIGK